MKRKPFNKTTMLIATIALCVIIVAGATYSWFTSTQNRVNRFETAAFDGNTTIFERFDPPKDWTPGTEVLKQVGALNSGDVDVFVRLSFHEMLQKLADSDLDTSTTKLTNQEPVLCKIEGFTTGNWKEITPGMLKSTSPAIPSDMKIYSLEYESKKKYGFFAYEPIGTTPETYHKIDIEPGGITYDPDTTDPGFVIDTTKIKYMYYSTFAATKTEYWVNDYSSGSLAIEYPPILPAPGYNNGNIRQAMTDALIKLAYVDANLEDFSNLGSTNGKWIYSEGYFYYIGKLAPGNVTPLLLNSVTLDSSAENEYQHMAFDLTVELQAIQANKDAIKDVWKLPTTDNNSNGWKIYKRLVELLA